MRTVGIIGGLGPETTSEFYLSVLFSAQQQSPTARPPLLIWNVPLPFAVEEEFILKATGAERYIPYLTDAAQRLERAGADFLVMPCNSLHIFIEQIRASVKILVMSIVEETTHSLKLKGVKQVGLLATTATLQNGMYDNALRKAGITPVLPDGLAQAQLGKLIHRLVQSRHTNRDRDAVLKVVETFASKNVHNVILACTDLQLLLPERPGIHIDDTMQILADATVREILKT